MSPPMNRYRWRPVGGSPVYNPANLAAGQIIAIDCDGLRHRPWRVETVRRGDDDRYSIAICPHGVDLASEQVRVDSSRQAPQIGRPPSRERR